MDLPLRPGRQLERPGRQHHQVLGFGCLEQRQRFGALDRPARPRPGHLDTPHQRPRPGVGQAGEVPPGKVAVPHIRHGPLHARLVLRFPGPRRVDQHAVVMGELVIGPVDLRVVEIRLDHPGLQVVRHQTAGQTTEELSRRHMGGDPLGLVHLERGPHEHVPAERQHQHERPQRPPPSCLRVEHDPEAAVVDLTFLARRRILPADRHPRQQHLLSQGHVRVAPQRRLAHGQAGFIPEPLMDRGQRVRGQPGLDPVMQPVALGEPRRAQLRHQQLGEPLLRQRHPRFGRHRRAPRDEPGRLRRPDVLPDRLAVDPQALRHQQLRPTRVPVLQDLDNVDHGKRSPCHWLPLPRRQDER